MKDWTDEQIQHYYIGTSCSEYPRVFWERIKQRLKHCRDVIDLGCGPGAFALAAVQDGYFVQAVDSNKKQLSALENKMLEWGRNTHCRLINSDWLDAEVEAADAVISAYCFGGSIGCRKGLEKIISKTKKALFFIMPYNDERIDFCGETIFNQLGKKIPVYGDCRKTLDNTLENLQSLGIKYDCELIEYDFGINLTYSSVERSTSFIAEKFDFEMSPMMREYVEDMIVEKDGCRWIPNPKTSVLISCNV